MTNTDFTNLTRRQIMKHFEQERHEWLAIGMNEADIFRIHFGEIDENGKGGDYRMWLDERKHSRSDHKYSHYKPVSLESMDYEGEWFSDNSDFLSDLIQAEDVTRLHTAISKLLPEQQTLIKRIYFNNEKIVNIAVTQGVSRPAISQRASTILRNLKKFLK